MNIEKINNHIFEIEEELAELKKEVNSYANSKCLKECFYQKLYRLDGKTFDLQHRVAHPGEWVLPTSTLSNSEIIPCKFGYIDRGFGNLLQAGVFGANGILVLVEDYMVIENYTPYEEGLK